MKTTKIILAAFLLTLFIVGMLMPLTQAQVQITGESLAKTGTGISRWSQTQKYNGSYSVKLGTLASGDTAEVKVPTDITFNAVDFDNRTKINFYGYVESTGAGLGAQLVMWLYCDLDGDGVADYALLGCGTLAFDGTAPESNVGAWKQYHNVPMTAGDIAWQLCNLTGTGPVHGVPAWTTQNYAAWNATAGFGADKIISVSVWLRYTYSASVIYVDTVTIGSSATTYDLEPDPITLYPTRGSIGTTVEVMAGAGSFTVGETVRTYFDATLVNTTTADANGALYATFTVPSSSPGTYDVTSVGETSGNFYMAPFTIPPPTIVLSPTSGPPDTTVTVTGEGFTVFGLVRIYFDTTLVKSISADSNGNIATTFNVPYKVPGTYTVKATDVSTGNYDTKPFLVPTPSITIVPTSGPPGTTVTITGGNFTLNGAIRIYFDTISVLNVTAEADGNIPSGSTFNVPAVPIGSYTVKALDVATGYYATAPFTVGPMIWIWPVSGPPATNVTVTGALFTINQTVRIYFDTTFIHNVMANATGGISTTFLVPDAPSGAHNVTAYDVVTGVWTSPQPFTIPATSITLFPTSAFVGANVTITGTKFKLNATVAIYFDTTMIKDVTANATGGIATWFIVPSVLPGPHTVTATDGINPATASFYVLGTGKIEDVLMILADVKDEVEAIEAKLDNATYGLVAIKTAIDTAKTAILMAISDAQSAILSAISGVQAKLDVLGSKVDAIRAKTDTIVWTDITAIKTAVNTVEAKLDAVRGGDVIRSKYENDKAVTAKIPYVISGLPANKVFTGTITLQIDTTLGSRRTLGIEVWDGDSWARVWTSTRNAPAGTSVSINVAGVTDGAGNAIRIVTTNPASRTFDYVFAYQIDIG